LFAPTTKESKVFRGFIPLVWRGEELSSSSDNLSARPIYRGGRSDTGLVAAKGKRISADSADEQRGGPHDGHVVLSIQTGKCCSERAA
jgi:hypothetical protein